MKSEEADILPVATPRNEQDELTGLPVLRTWRRVYLFIFGSFILWVLLLLVLTLRYQ